jgi:hypothetical protein
MKEPEERPAIVAIAPGESPEARVAPPPPPPPTGASAEAARRLYDALGRAYLATYGEQVHIGAGRAGGAGPATPRGSLLNARRAQARF